MSDLATFLLARIVEDEALARACEGERWELALVWQSWQVRTVERVGPDPQYAEHRSITRDFEGLSDSVSEIDGSHIARHDPARVLAECAAKRAIVELHSTFISTAPVWAASETPSLLKIPIYTLKALAMPYADHGDYRDEWSTRDE